MIKLRKYSKRPVSLHRNRKPLNRFVKESIDIENNPKLDKYLKDYAEHVINFGGQVDVEDMIYQDFSDNPALASEVVKKFRRILQDMTQKNEVLGRRRGRGLREKDDNIEQRKQELRKKNDFENSTPYRKAVLAKQFIKNLNPWCEHGMHTFSTHRVGEFDENAFLIQDWEEQREKLLKKYKKQLSSIKSKLGITEGTEIPVKHPGVLEVPEGKNVDDLPMSHFEKLANKKGLGKITKALNNLQVWNKKKNPELAKWADSMIDKLNKKLKKDEGIKRHYRSLGEVYKDYGERLLTSDYEPVCEGYIGWKERLLTFDDDYQEGVIEEILTDAKEKNDRIEWEVDYDGGFFGGERVFHIYSDGDTYEYCKYKMQELRDDAIYERGYYESVGRKKRTCPVKEAALPREMRNAKIVTKNFFDMIDRMEKEWGFDCIHYDRDYLDEIPDSWLTVYDSEGNEYECEFYKYSDGRYEIYLRNCNPTGNNMYKDSEDDNEWVETHKAEFDKMFEESKTKKFKGIKEGFGLDSAPGLYQKVYQIIRDNHINAEITECSDGESNGFVDIDVDGDWKHDHARLKYLLNQAFDTVIINVKESFPSDSDSYRCIYSCYLGNLNGAFGESTKRRRKRSIKEGTRGFISPLDAAQRYYEYGNYQLWPDLVREELLNKGYDQAFIDEVFEIMNGMYDDDCASEEDYDGDLEDVFDAAMGESVKKKKLPESLYSIMYDYDYDDDMEKGGVYTSKNNEEHFRGSWSDLQDYLKQMRKQGCYNIDANEIGDEYYDEDNYEDDIPDYTEMDYNEEW